jgi:hypothetical protein
MLNDTAIKALKPTERQYKRGDSEQGTSTDSPHPATGC